MRKLTGKIVIWSAVLALTAGLNAVPLKAAELSEDAAAEENAEGTEDGSDVLNDIIAAEEAADDAAASSGDLSSDAAIQGPDGCLISAIFADELIPLGFHKTQITYQGQQAEAAQLDNGTLLVLYVSDASGAAANYKIYDEMSGTLSDFRMIAGPNDKFIIILNASSDMAAPAGFEKAVLDWNGQTLSAYINSTVQPAEGADALPSEYILVYAVSNEGRVGWYLYDQTEGTYQRYAGLGAASGAGDEESLLDIEAVKEGDNTALIRLIIICALALIAVILIVIVVILAHKLREYGEYEYIDEDVYNAASAANARNEHIYNVMSEGTVDDGEAPAYYAKASAGNEAAAPKHYEENQDDYYESRQTDEYADAPRQGVNNGRRAILETGDIADLDDILNDPDATSDLPLPAQIEMAARAAADAAAQPPKGKASDTLAEAAPQKAPVPDDALQPKSKVSDDTAIFADMQVTVDKFDAGMPAMVDTDAINEGAKAHTDEMRRITGPQGNYPEVSYDSDASYEQNPPYDSGASYNHNASHVQEIPYSLEEPFNPEYEDDWDYISKEERKERKAIYKEQMREYKEALKDAKYMEKERKKALKRKNKGFAEPEAMDWGSFQSSMPEGAADERRPRGNNADALPSYVRSDILPGQNVNARSGDMSAQGGDVSAPAQSAGEPGRDIAAKAQKVREQGVNEAASQEPKRELTEEERASAAADAVIRAARGTGHTGDIMPKAGINTENGHERVSYEDKAYDDGLKSEQDYRDYRQGARNVYENYRQQDEERERSLGPMKDPQFTQDLDEDFEFEFLNIRHP